MTGNEIELKDEERQPCEIRTRVMGYHRPVSEFNKGKKSEFYSRVCFCESKAVAFSRNHSSAAASAASLDCHCSALAAE